MAKFCTNCGAPLEDGKECTSCGNGTKKATEVKVEEKNNESKANNTTSTSTNSGAKNKVAAIVLACPFLIGGFGIHNFYLGYTNKGIAQLLLTLVGWILCGLGPVVAWIWALVDFIQLLSGSISTDANGVPLE
ncbi:MAG: NINE protein [Bacilli bacterium]|nr:NINE protein [Bacilli bacterium]